MTHSYHFISLEWIANQLKYCLLLSNNNNNKNINTFEYNHSRPITRILDITKTPMFIQSYTRDKIITIRRCSCSITITSQTLFTKRHIYEPNPHDPFSKKESPRTIKQIPIFSPAPTRIKALPTRDRERQTHISLSLSYRRHGKRIKDYDAYRANFYSRRRKERKTE